MAGKLDISKLAERLAQLNTKNNTGGSSLDFITIKDGRNLIRVLPPKDGAEWFAKEVFVHYGVGKKGDNKGTMVVCPTTYGDDKPCPVCELSRELYNLSKKKDDNYSKQAREIGRKKRVYYNAINRAEDLSVYEKNEEGKWINKDSGEEERPVKVFASGIGVYKDIMGIIVDPEYGDITDATVGLDLIITKSGTGFNTNYDVKTVRKESAIGFEDWEECLNDLESLGKIKTYDEIASIMSGEDIPSTKEDADENDTTPDNTNSTPAEDTEECDDLQTEIKNALNRRKRG